MTAALLLTLDTEPTAVGPAAVRRDASPPGPVVERFCKLLDAHAITGTWFVHQDTPGSLLGAIRAMRTRQDLLPRPRASGLLRPGVALATRTHAISDLEGGIEVLLAGVAGRGGFSGEWMPKALRLVGFRSSLERAIRTGAVCHLHIRLAELARRPSLIRLFEDLLFCIAEQRRSRRLRVVTVSDARRARASERATEAA